MRRTMEEALRQYETLLKEIWEASAKYLGVLSVNLLVERVVWDVSLEYQEIELLQYDQEGISCEKIAGRLAEKPDLPVDDIFMKFITRYVKILAKLLGHERTEAITKKIEEELTQISLSREEGQTRNG